MRYFCFWAAIWLAATLPNASMAGFFLEIQMANVDVSPVPTRVGVDVYAYTSLGDPPEPITGFDLRFDLQGPGGVAGGQALPSGITRSTEFITNVLLASAPLPGGAGTMEILNSPGGANRDFYINGDNGTVSTNINALPSKTRLFTFNFDIEPGTASGVYALSFVQRNDVYGPDPGFNEISGISFTNGGFSITAVPEPASLGLVGIAFGAFAIRCWRQKRKTVRVGNRQ